MLDLTGYLPSHIQHALLGSVSTRTTRGTCLSKRRSKTNNLANFIIFDYFLSGIHVSLTAICPPALVLSIQRAPKPIVFKVGAVMVGPFSANCLWSIHEWENATTTLGIVCFSTLGTPTVYCRKRNLNFHSSNLTNVYINLS